MLLITGATGNIGRELVGQLAGQETGLRVLVRDPARAAALPERVERVMGDLGDPSSLARAFDGIQGLFLLNPGLGIDYTEHAVAAARAAGVRRIVLLSSINVLGDPMPAMGHWHHEREEIVRAGGIPGTILRPAGFMTNALEWVPTLRDGGYVLDPIGPGRHAPIDPADIAAVAARALTEDGHDGREYLLTGGEALTVAEQVQILGTVLGRTIEVREAGTPEEIVRSRYSQGASPALADALLESLTRARADTTGVRTDTVARLLGRAPVTFRVWCERNAHAFTGGQA
ncbi:NAD-dependent epimerase/dehydratase family protein [Amycolatopsis rhizosphaerae]|uniref:NAD-dependent epimerase/dehydratase family protein n=1 Tax=Amycolatopsis rhizosphaerae TaxID=2053003 RepID=A0A558D0Z8_9PSEU|nr:NAD(P)H-binding protein [Amycolatopsis rhizosphaerae]TVT54656.1 NAD-dependent epimerase/dehydratase family protein [Amycolatopsis rhizosphaerae]